MRTIFLADAHLKLPNDRNYQMLLQFLHELEGDTETLYILGDLFDFWLGFPSQPFPHYEAVLTALENLVRSGCRLVYLEGNHDFHLGAVFRERLQAEIHLHPVVKSINGHRIFLCHGDQINPHDYGYRCLRMLLHNRITASLVHIFPPSTALRIRELLQKRSRNSYLVKTSKWNYRTIIREFALSIRKQGYDGMVCGHFHLPFKDSVEDGSFTILSLGDWQNQLNYGEMLDNQLLLKTYK